MEKIDNPSVKVTIPWDKPRGIGFMLSGFTPVVSDLCPSMKVTIPRDKPRGIDSCHLALCQWYLTFALA